MSAKIIRSKETTQGTFINTIAHNATVEDEILGIDRIEKDWFYFESADAIEEGTELPKFTPSAYNIRVSEFTTVDEETGEEQVRQAKWLDGRKQS